MLKNFLAYQTIKHYCIILLFYIYYIFLLHDT